MPTYEEIMKINGSFTDIISEEKPKKASDMVKIEPTGFDVFMDKAKSGKYQTVIDSALQAKGIPKKSLADKILGGLGKFTGAEAVGKYAGNVVLEGIDLGSDILNSLKTGDISELGKSTIEDPQKELLKGAAGTARVGSMFVGGGAALQAPSLLGKIGAGTVAGGVGGGIEGGLEEIERTGDIDMETLEQAGKTAVMGASIGGALPVVGTVAGKIASKALGTGKKALEKTSKKIAETKSKIFIQDAETAEKLAKGLDYIDTKKIKTFDDGKKAVQTAIKDLSEEQGKYLSQFDNPIGIEDLSVKTKVGDTLVEQNFVADGLDDLEKLYTRERDLPNAERIRQLRVKIENEGATPVQLNELAKEYGKEFKDKAFTKTGELKHSDIGQGFEANRKGIKETLRKTLPDDYSKGIDKQISELYDTESAFRDLTSKTERLIAKASNRGWIEAAGGNLTKIADSLTGHFGRGFLNALRISNEGGKTFNHIQMQKLLFQKF
jgi:hypothetical protein